MSLISKYSVTIHPKRIKNISIRIKPDSSVHMSVPTSTSTKQIEHILKQKSKWIERKLVEISSKQSSTPMEFLDGDEIYYLGDKYVIKLISSHKSYVEIIGDTICLTTNDIYDTDKKRKLLHRWYHSQAEIIFRQIIDMYLSITKKEINIMRIRR